MRHKVIPTMLTAEMVRSYIDFDGNGQAPGKQAMLQSEAVAGLWELMRLKSFAYLGDEVGTGKTRQAMGVIATQFLHNPDSRVIVICSDEEMQRQWQSEWSQFLRSCYQLVGCVLVPEHGKGLKMSLHHNLRAFVDELRKSDGARIHLLRYSSFSRPFSLGANSPKEMLEKYAACLGLAGDELLREERGLAGQVRASSKAWQQEMTEALRPLFCKRLGNLLTPGKKTVDLVICDEAQYLRNTDNARNENIGEIFRRRVARWLFMSATPLHSGPRDIASLDYFLCQKDFKDKTKPPYPKMCGNCEVENRCSQMSIYFQEKGVMPDAVELLKPIMIRRARTYSDGDQKAHLKLSYRNYRQLPYSGADDVFLSMTMALVQKRIVAALDGRPERIKNGALISFESLSASLSRSKAAKKAEDNEPSSDLEPAQDGKHEGEGGVAADRNAVDELNASFGKAMRTKYSLPHAKLNSVVEELYKRSFEDGSVSKTLVFVRRIDSVEEIRDMLHMRFQDEVDARIAEWRLQLLATPASSNPLLWEEGNFWKDEPPENESLGNEEPTEDSEEDDQVEGYISHYRAAERLSYFEARKKADKRKPDGRKAGILAGLADRLRRNRDVSQKPLRGFLLKRPSGELEAGGSEQDKHWRANPGRWQKFLRLVVESGQLEKHRADPARRWMFDEKHDAPDLEYKLASLQLCLLQTICHTDFLVDLYILHHYDQSNKSWHLPEKLLWLLERGEKLGHQGIAASVRRFKTSCRNWIEHFDLIVDKCLRTEADDNWRTIYDARVSPAFLHLQPVVGRSGRLQNMHAVPQFKFPCYPNVMVCTDVLKQGVDMHLFCDTVEHYGVAWTSGDLEQRIGRVDRLGSLISRKIGQYKAAGADVMARLEVRFPYLDGTLDKRQVRGILHRKIMSDLTLDMQKRKEDIGHITPDNLDEALPQVLPERGLRSDAVFFPEAVRFVMEIGGAALPLPSHIKRRKVNQQ